MEIIHSVVSSKKKQLLITAFAMCIEINCELKADASAFMDFLFLRLKSRKLYIKDSVHSE